MAIIQKVKVGDEWVKVSSSNNSGSSSSGTDIFVINSDKDFEVIEDNSLVGVIKDSNTTYEKLKNAINNNYTIALKEPRGNLSYCLRADFVLEDQESGNKRIALFFTKSILTIRYDIMLYIGLNNSILYMISKNDIFSKQEVEESIDNKAPSVGSEAPTTDTVLWIDTDDESGETGGGGSSSGESVTIEVDDALSLESTNPVQNKVLTEALEGKSNKRVIYMGDSEEELNYNLETLSLLGGANAPELYTAEGMVFQFSVNANEQPCFISVSLWSLYLPYLPELSINDMYITINSTGLAEMHTPEGTTLGSSVSVPSGELLKGMGSDWVNLVIENGEADLSPLPLKSLMNSSDSGSAWMLPNRIEVVKESGVATGVNFYYFEGNGNSGIIRFGLDGKMQDLIITPIAIDSTADSTSSSVIAKRKLAYSLGAQIDGCTTLKKVLSSGTHEGSGITMLCYDHTILDGTNLKVWRLWEDGYLELKSTTSLI